jgi:hypothetical protein
MRRNETASLRTDHKDSNRFSHNAATPAAAFSLIIFANSAVSRPSAESVAKPCYGQDHFVADRNRLPENAFDSGRMRQALLQGLQ